MNPTPRYAAALYTLLCVGAAAATGTIALNDSRFSVSSIKPIMHAKSEARMLRDACLIDHPRPEMQFRYGSGV